MQYVHYLKKIILAWRTGACSELAERMQANLRRQAKAQELSSDAVPRIHLLGEFTSDALTAALREGSATDGGILWLTDDPLLAGALLRAAQPVLACASAGAAYFDGVKYVCEQPEELELSYLENIYRRALGIPWDICETERCRIRETTVADVDAFYHIYSDPSITRYMEALYEDPEQERAYIRDYIDKVYAFYDIGVWTVLWKETGEVIGRAGLSYREGFDTPELGFVIGTPWQGRGVAQEVCRAVLSYGREQFAFSKILAFVSPANRASCHICENLGFHPARQLLLGGQPFLQYEYTYDSPACR